MVFPCNVQNAARNIPIKSLLKVKIYELESQLTKRAADGFNVPQIGSFEQSNEINKKVVD